MKKINCVILCAMVLLAVSCKKDPLIDVNIDFFTFSENALTKSLTISNSGEKELEWSIDNKISWLSISPGNGTIDPQGESVLTLNASKYNEPGLYNSTFLISTNGGDKNITVEMDLDFTPEIYIGIGIEGINLNETYESIKTKLGGPDELAQNQLTGSDYTEHIAIYNNLGIGFYFYNTLQTIDDNNETFAIGLTSPYNGVTKMNIGIETPFANVKKCYGQPDEIFDDDNIIYSYTSKGVDFLSFDSKVAFIWVFNPFTTKSLHKNIPLHHTWNRFNQVSF